MDSTVLIEEAIEYVRKVFENDFSGHDFYHSVRVYKSAVNLAKEEGADETITALAALLHDVDDRKLSPETCAEKENAVFFLKGHGVKEETILRIRSVISQVSFAGSDSIIPDTIEGKCVQDADRLDALGAIGIARTFAYGGSHQRAIYDPEEAPLLDMSAETYYSHKSCSVNHFHEKLFLLKDMMNTSAGKKEAKRRDSYMREFLKEFLMEWDGQTE